MITLDLRPEKTIVRVGDATIGGDELAIIAGPCAIESRAQAFAIAEAVRRSGARFFRGGAYKPRTSPYAFQGLGEEGLRILADIREAYGLKIVTEALDEPGVDLVETIRRHDSDRRTKHAEFFPAPTRRKSSNACVVEAWTVGNVG